MKTTRSIRWLVVTTLVVVVSGSALSAVAGASVTSLTKADRSSAATAGVPALSHVHIRLSASSLIVGQSLTATVVVVPRSAQRTVDLQRQMAHRWRNLAAGVTNASGQFTVHLDLKTPATYRIRAAVPATATASSAFSPTDVLLLSPVPPPYAGANLAPGSTGSQVLALEQRLTQLGYWLGTPGSYFGDATEQAVWAFQKAAGLSRSGVVGPSTVAALQAGVVPTPRSKSGYVVEVDLNDDLIMFVDNGKVLHVLNTSTGGGYTYTENGETDQAITPTGVFHIFSAVDGLVTDSLGSLWRPRFFYEGFAIHGDSYVPPEPVSHGCARVSDEAIDWIWADNLLPIGTEVWVY